MTLCDLNRLGLTRDRLYSTNMDLTRSTQFGPNSTQPEVAGLSSTQYGSNSTWPKVDLSQFGPRWTRFNSIQDGLHSTQPEVNPTRVGQRWAKLYSGWAGSNTTLSKFEMGSTWLDLMSTQQGTDSPRLNVNPTRDWLYSSWCEPNKEPTLLISMWTQHDSIWHRLDSIFNLM